jgi:hypothetical protein
MFMAADAVTAVVGRETRTGQQIHNVQRSVS